MFVVGVAVWINIIVVISLCMSFVLYVLINARKIGFLKAVKSKTAITIIVWIFICGGLPLLSLIPRSGNQLFKDFILNPVPKSVKVLDSYDGSPDMNPDFCLHFKISPDDFKLILASKDWQTVSDTDMGGLQCDYKNPAWNFMFTPPSLGSNVITYTFIPRERDFEVMFTNLQMDEVYYYYSNGNLP